MFARLLKQYQGIGESSSKQDIFQPHEWCFHCDTGYKGTSKTQTHVAQEVVNL